MHIETQTKTRNTRNFLRKSSIACACIAITACSFVELKPGAEHIIFAKQGDDCEQLKAFTAEVKTSTLFIDRRPEAIANELQILAQNEAYSLYANAIWPISEIKEGKQNFDILICKPI
tara:strand:+ start:13440 stop:13793 length:354 start_codon:yes stop_codon:yes gene_type:complete